MYARALLAVVATAAAAGSASGGSLAPVGSDAGPGRLLFVSGTTNLQIQAIDADGKRRTELTKHGPSGDRPQWARHGEALSFEGRDGGLWLMRPDGTHARRVTGYSDYRALSPDGRLVATLIDGSAGRLLVTTVPGKTVRTIRLGYVMYASDPAWSPDGRFVAFDVYREGVVERSRIWVVDVARGRAQPISPPRALDTDPSWAPEGRRIAFLASGGPGDASDLYVMGSDGSRRKLLAARVYRNGAWSPSGREILFTRGRLRQERLFVVSAGDGPERPLATGGPVTDAAWAPDGRQLVVSDGKGVSLVTLGGKARRLTTLGAGSSVDWSPATRIAFTDSGSIYTIRPDGRGLRRLTSRVDDVAPVWSPDGRRIAFVREDSARSRRGPAIWTMRADGSHESAFGPGLAPSWSPDGRQLVHSLLPSAETEKGGPIVVRSVETGRGVVVARGKSPTWSPDGGFIAFLRARGSRSSALYLVTPNGAGSRVLFDGKARPEGDPWNEELLTELVWSPDGTRIALPAAAFNYESERFRAWIRVIGLDGSTRVLPVDASRGLDWSPDGSALAVANEHGIFVVPVDGRPLRRVVRASPGGKGVWLPAWSADGGQLAYAECDMDDACHVAIVRTDGEGGRRLTRLDQAELGRAHDIAERAPTWRPESRARVP